MLHFAYGSNMSRALMARCSVRVNRDRDDPPAGQATCAAPWKRTFP